jgi:hypothetical protein
MISIQPKKFIAIGFVLVLFGFLVPLLMVIKVIEAGYILGFLSYGASVSGLLLGIIGAFSYTRLKRGKRNE